MILITTPTGNIGSQVVEQVLASNQPIRIIARDLTRLPMHVRDRAQVLEGEHNNSALIHRACEGIDSVFWLVPPSPKASNAESAYLDFTRPACEAFNVQGVKRVVGVSALGRGSGHEGNAGLATAALAMDALIAQSGVAYRALLMPSFMDNMLRQLSPINSLGKFFSPLPGDAKYPTCATRDIASKATELLLDPSWSGVAGVPVMGPEDLSLTDMARTLSQVLGKTVTFQQTTLEGFRAQLLGQGMSGAMAQGVVDMYAAKMRGLDNKEPRTPAASTPTSFHQWCEEVMKPAIAAINRSVF
ncbi:NmrA family transcriptional regulator [Hydrogenophaga crassostreae]|uniref:NmrA family transcriptional regulator n=2 Tax=Hydrogenophaga crassostreae TaxID=1763535 RepID=A0A162VYQ0_9BURK|nr:NAD(P)H-binding protein [Hydrogenophaga crassostreae]AOW15376.1 NmrA family transcriptional regulator [Hydrogenophaga crassostreae]OAD41331.1 NmrA family transcriptional regulator [Hydrogenophaga crassostreae]